MSVIRSYIESAYEPVGADNIDERVRIYLFDFLDKTFQLVCSDHRIYHLSFGVVVSPVRLDAGSSVARELVYCVGDFFRKISHDKHGITLVTLVDKVDDLR